MGLNYPGLFFREPYKSIIKFYLFILVSNSIISLTFLLIIWVLSDSTNSFLNILNRHTGQVIRFSIIANVLIFTYLLILSFNTFKLYVLLPSWESQEYTKFDLTSNEKISVGYAPPFVAFIASIIIFLLGYYIQGEFWKDALSIALAAVFPFLVALASVGLVGVTIVLILGTFGYVVRRKHH